MYGLDIFVYIFKRIPGTRYTATVHVASISAAQFDVTASLPPPLTMCDMRNYLRSFTGETVFGGAPHLWATLYRQTSKSS